MIHPERLLQFLEPRDRSSMTLPAERLEHLECVAQTLDPHAQLVERSSRRLVVELAAKAHRTARDQPDQLSGSGAEGSVSADLFDRRLRHLRREIAKAFRRKHLI